MAESLESISCNVDISVVIPVYQNADTLVELAGRLVHVLSGITGGFELVFVDDASPDTSAQVLQHLRTRYPHIVVVSLESNVGQQQAVRTGIMKARGDRLVVMDADLQDSPEAVVLLINALTDGAVDAVFAAHQGRYQGALRMVTSRSFKWLIRLLTGLPKGAGSFVAFSRRMADSIIAHDTPKFYLAGLICFSGYPVSAIGVERNRRPGGRSSFSSAKRLHTGISYIRCLLEVKLACLSNRVK